MARFFDSVLAGATVAPSGAFLVVSAALVAGAAGAVAGDVVSAASTGAASRPTASRDAAIRFIVREPRGPRLDGTGPGGYGGASLRGQALTRRRRCARSVRAPDERLDADAVQLSDAPGSRMSARPARFDAPSPFDRVFNRLFGILVGLGLALPHNYLLQVRGRKSGRLYSTPIDVLEHGGRRFLVAGRGETQWVRNARASGQVTLRKGMRGEACRLRALSDAEKPEVLKAYLDRFKMTVQRYFPIPAGSPVEKFAPVAAGYPVFELNARAHEGDVTSGE